MAGTRIARSAHRRCCGRLEHDSARLGIRARTTQGRASSGRYGQAQGDGEQALAARRAAMGAGSSEQRGGGNNGSTKLSSILTVQNSKLHIET